MGALEEQAAMSTHNRKAKQRLERRRADFARIAHRSDMKFHRPGSMKK